MKKILKVQFLSLVLLCVLLMLVIVRMPITNKRITEFDIKLVKSHLKDIRKDLDGSLVSTSNDPYIILPKVTINKPYRSFLYINVGYSPKGCGTRFEETPSFIQIFWRALNDNFSENKSDAAPIALKRSNYLIPLRSLSKLTESSEEPVNLEFRLDIINKAECKFNLNKVIFGSFKVS